MEINNIIGRKKVLNYKDIILWIVILGVSVIFFCFVGERGYIAKGDALTYISAAQISLGLKEGVGGLMTVYPSFLHVLYRMFGEEYYLMMAAFVQGVIGAVCAIDFSIFIKKQFGLNRAEFFIVFLLSLLVYTISIPESVTTHEILTEALAYPLFYVCMKYLLRGILNNSKKDLILGLVWALILSLIRGQLQLLWIVSAMGIAWCYLKTYMKNEKKEKTKKKYIHYVFAVVIFGFIVFSGMKIYSYSMYIYNEVAYGGINAGDSKNGALWCRISYTMDEEDVELLQRKRTREIYSELFEAVDKAQTRYPYRPKNLWTWNHIANSTAQNAHVESRVIRDYLKKMQITGEEAREIEAIELNTISETLLKKHWGRYLYYTLCMVPQGMVCTVFIQKEAFYGLCYAITFTIYLYAIIGAIILLKNKKLNSQVGECMLVIVITAFSFIGITNLVYMGIQRYLYYLFGVFYIGLFLVTRELWKEYGTKVWNGLRNVRKDRLKQI